MLCGTHATLQDMYVALPVPAILEAGENAGSFAFLQDELLSVKASSKHSAPPAAVARSPARASMRAHRLRRLA